MAKKHKKITTKDGLSRAGWLRQQILFRPTITHEQVVSAYDKAGMPADERPDGQALYTARNGLLKRYGFNSMDDIPRTRTGELNMAGLVRCFLKINPEASLADAEVFFFLDGLVVSKATFDYARYHSQGSAVTTVSPDENQDTGPRAGAETRKKRVKKHRRTKAERLAELKDDAATFEKMERALEGLIEAAEHLGKSRLIQKLRDARRAASAAMLECTG